MANLRLRAGGLWIVGTVGAVGITCLVLPACSSAFSDCETSRDCANSGGSAGQADSSGASNKAGASNGGAPSKDNGVPTSTAGASIDDAGGAAGGEPVEGNANAGAGDDASAGGAGGTAGSGGTGASVPVDAVPPTILSITPVNGATKLTPATDKIVITFSEPMNKATAQSAYVPGVAGTLPVFSWNAASTQLTIDPKLAYPTATDAAAAATPFNFSVTTAAKDLAGNPLAANVSWQFTLLREITQSFGYSSGGNFADGASRASFAGAGDDSHDLSVRGFLSYDISALPDEIVTLESATLSSHIVGIIGDPFGLFGNMLIHSLSFTAIDQTAYDAPPLHDLGVFIAATGTNAAGDLVSKDVLTALKDDYANRIARNNLSQYKLLFPASPNSNSVGDFAYLSSGATSNMLIVKYLHS
jgi:Bacterial Ig-like domain